MNIGFGLSVLICLCVADAYGANGPFSSPTSKDVTVDLRRHTSVIDWDTECFLGVSSDGKSIALCINDWSGGGGDVLTFGIDGTLLSKATEAGTPPLSLQDQEGFRGIGEGVRLVSPSGTDSPLSVVDASASNCVRMVRGSGTVMEGASWKVELLRLKPKAETLWRVDLPRCHFGIADAGFFETAGEHFIVVAHVGHKAWILRQRDGGTVGECEYGRRETEAELVAYRNRHGLGDVDIGDPSLQFSARCVSFDPTRRIVACGASYGRRIRIISVDPPGRILKELHSDDRPVDGAGVWGVQRVDVVGGRFLIAEHFRGGGAWSREKRTHEVYDLDTWERLWQSQDIHMRCVTVSNDGGIMAYIRNGSLCIVPAPWGRSRSR